MSPSILAANTARLWLLTGLIIMLAVACDGGNSALEFEATVSANDTTPTPTVSAIVSTRIPGLGPEIIVPSVVSNPTPTAITPVVDLTAVSPTKSPTVIPEIPIPTPVNTPTPETTVHTATPTPPDPLPTPVVPSPSPPPNATAGATPSTTPTATATRIPTPTPVFFTPQPVPTPTSQPTSASYGVISSGDLVEYHLSQLGVDWYIDYNPDTRTAPPGTNKVPFVSVKPGKPRLTSTEITTFTSAAPGSTWYIGGEPNVPQQDGISPQAYADELDYYSTQIRAADPTAKIMGPSILNWDFTCTGCGGFQSGESWMREFVDSYAITHAGSPPPIDIWAIDAYPLTWFNLPMTNWQLVRDQLIGYRQYLRDEVPGQADAPIWVTEISSHWAFDGFTVVNEKLTIPDGQDFQADFMWDEVSVYMEGILGWLQDNAVKQNIDRWFFYKDWVDISSTASEGYAGIHFFESGASDAALNPLGQVYHDFATGQR
jgi:hypothetical protein